MAQIDINTSQNVNLTFTTANIGERFLAFVVDNIIKIAFIYFLSLILIGVLNLDAYTSNWDIFSLKGLEVILMFPFLFYTLVFESLMEGQTPGKKLLKIKVVKIDGFQASFPDYLIRWVFRIVDFGLFFIPGFISMIVTKTNSRLGDIASGTAVISLKNNINISHTILEKISNDKSGQGAAEYILLFGGVIVIAIFALTIYKSYMQTSDSNLKVKDDISEVRTTVRENNSILG